MIFQARKSAYKEAKHTFRQDCNKIRLFYANSRRLSLTDLSIQEPFSGKLCQLPTCVVVPGAILIIGDHREQKFGLVPREAVR